MPTAFGTGWLERLVRARFRVTGPQPYPQDLEPKAQVSIDARPSLPWDWGNARWLPAAGGVAIGAGGAGTFASIRVCSTTLSQRAFVIEEMWVDVPVAGQIGAYFDTAFVAPTVGMGLRDPRFRGPAASSFTPLADVGLGTQNAAVALPAVGTRVWEVDGAAGVLVEVLAFRGYIVMPGTQVEVFSEVANTALRGSVSGWVVPIEDLPA